MKEHIETLIRKIESLPEEISWYGPATDAEINEVESALNCKFPVSFREFLRLTGGGGLESLWISGLEPNNPLSESFGSIYGDTTLYRNEWNLPPHLVIVQRDQDENEPFCINVSETKSNECPVVLYYFNSGKTENIASNFISFYEMYLEPYFEANGITS